MKKAIWVVLLLVALFIVVRVVLPPLFLPSSIATIATVAGIWDVGDFSGDGGAATAARLNEPYDVAVDSAGNLFIADEDNHRIRKVDTVGIITTVAGSGAIGHLNGSFSGDGGAATAAQLDSPGGIAIDSAGNLFIADTGNARIRKVDTTGIITTVAGNGSSGFSGDGGAATAAQLSFPFKVAVDSAGNLFIADWGDHRIRKVNTAGIITTVAGTGTWGFSGDGGPATSAQLSRPEGIAVDNTGNLFIADSDNHRIRKVDTSGIITTVAGSGTASWNNGGFSGDGRRATAAQLNRPKGISVDSVGNLFIADSRNYRIRKVNTDGIITTVAGSDDFSLFADGVTTTAEPLRATDVVVDSAGNLFIAEFLTSRVRKVTFLDN
ncbi:MAG: NHL repeat-containing protein [Deinococcota bacterium]